MNGNLYSPKADALEVLRRRAEGPAPEPVDFSERIMERIYSEAQFPIATARRRKRKTLTIAAIAIAVALLSGFTYAASKGYLIIQDKSGRDVMLVEQWEREKVDPAVAAINQRIQDAVTGSLGPMEAAHMLVGPEAIEALKTYDPSVFDKSFTLYGENFGKAFSTFEEISPYLVDGYGRLKRLGDEVGGAELSKLIWSPNEGMGTMPIQPEQWVEATDAESGYPYAYHKFTVDRQAGSLNDSVLLIYKDAKVTYKLNVHYNSRVMFQLFDENPSADRIREVAGTPVYVWDKEDEWANLSWSQPIDEGSLVFSLYSTPADTKKQLSFAKAVIETLSADKE